MTSPFKLFPTVYRSNMKVWIYILTFAVSSSSVLSQACPFSATFIATIEQTTDSPIILDDPELIFFRNTMRFKEEEIQHVFNAAINFFNDSYGLDFSASVPNEQNERFFENAKMSLVRLHKNINYIVAANNWIRNGNTHSTCYKIREGGFQVTFLADQTLYGSYGGADGKPAGMNDAVAYGFINIDACQQSPVIIQFQTATPHRAEPVDGTFVINCDLYNRVLGYGKVHGIGIIKPDPDEPGQYHITGSTPFTFPAL